MSATDVDGSGIPFGSSSRLPAPAPAGPLVEVDERGRDDRRRTGPVLHLGVLLVVGLSLLVVLAIGVAMAAGLRAFDVRTPSMGTTAPVGSAVVTEPLRGAAVHVGDVVAFRAPVGGADAPYTHRIAAVDGDRITTKGDANGAVDAWTITREDVLGRVVSVLPGVGWLVRGLPWVAAGTALVWAATAFIRLGEVRTALRLLGVTMSVAVTSAVLRPFVEVVSLGTSDGEHPVARVVSTGMLPVIASAPEGGSVRLTSGAVGEVALAEGATGTVQLAARLDLSPVGWAVFGLCCAVPLVVSVFAARTRLNPVPDA